VSVQFMRALLDEILGKGYFPIRIVESNSTGKCIDKAFDDLGYSQLAEEYRARGHDVSLVNLSTEPTKTVPFNGLYFKEVKFPKILLGQRFFISVAKAKSHDMTHVTGAMKNLFGCLPEKDKAMYHRFIDKVIVDLNAIIKPDLNIVDARVGMEGVYTGKLIRLGVLLCGRNSLCVDATLAKVMGFDPLKIKHIALAERQGLGMIHPKVIGEQVESVATKFQKPKLSPTYQVYLNLPERLCSIIRKTYRSAIKRETS